MARRFYISLLFILFISYSVSASQTGSVSGIVNDAANGEALIGATVAIDGTDKGTVTDLDGKYRIDQLAPGSYTLKFSYIGYTPKSISGVEVKSGEVATVNVTITVTEGTTLQEVVVNADLKKENINSILVARKNSAVVSDAISADMIRRSPDKNTSDVLKRVSGVTIQDNKFVVVRGMNDRYNSAMLNNSVLPSSEPDRKTFAFDIFPAAVLDNITIMKSASPDLPGDFSGGLVEINTKDIPDKNFLSIKVGASYNSISTFNPYYGYQGGKTDWLGLDDGTRGLPGGFPSHDQFIKLGETDRITTAQSLLNTWAVQSSSSMPLNPKVELAGGFNLQSPGESDFGGIFGVTYNDTRKFAPLQRLDYYGLDAGPGDTVYNYTDSNYTRNVLTSILADFAFKLNANNKFFLNNIYSINSTDQTVTREGYNFSQAQYVTANSFYFASNKLLNNQIGGEHFIPGIKLRINWSGYVTHLNRDEPDYRRNIYQGDSPGGPFYCVVSSSPSTNTGAGLRYYGAIDDHAQGGNIDLGLPFALLKQQQNIKIGGAIYDDQRTRDARVFSSYISDPGSFNYYFASQDTIFSPEHYNLQDGFSLSEDKTPTNHYDGTINNTAAYAMLDNKFTEKLRLVWGLRMENYHYTLNTFDASNQPLKLDSTYLDFLPSANLIFSVLKSANLRFSFSRTVARPSYRELANAPFYDFLQNITYYGNTNLVETHITNYEVRWEHYFSNGQYYSASGFYKNFQNPIEQNLFLPGADSRSVIFVNVPRATNTGFELEARKNFSFIGKGWENLYIYANLTYINSKVFVSGATSDTSAHRPLEGQSPIVFNASLMYTEPKTNLGVSLLFNSMGHRLYLVGSVTDPPVWQKVHPTLDLKVSKSFLKNGLVEVSWYDILHGDDILYEDHNNNEKYSDATSTPYSSMDKLIQRQRNGYNLSLAVSYKF